MVVSEFLRDLLQEEERILKDVESRDSNGERIVGVKGFEQMLPVLSEDETEDETKIYPYFILRANEGRTENDDDPWMVDVTILFGCHDEDRQANGHRHILTMIERTVDRFAAEPQLCKKYRARQDMEWALQDEDTYPYYFGAVRIKFDIPKVGRREPVYGNRREKWKDFC